MSASRMMPDEVLADTDVSASAAGSYGTAGSQPPLAVCLHQLVSRKMTLFRLSLTARGVVSEDETTLMSRYVQALARALQAVAEVLMAPSISAVVIIDSRSFGKTTMGTQVCDHLNMLPLAAL